MESSFMRDGISSQYSVEGVARTNARSPSFAARLRRWLYPILSHRKAFLSLAEMAEKFAPALDHVSINENKESIYSQHWGWAYSPGWSIVYGRITWEVLGYDGSLAGIASLGEDQGNIQPNDAGTLRQYVSDLELHDDFLWKRTR